MATTTTTSPGTSSGRQKGSPAWKNPQDLFRRHLKRKSSSRRLLPDASSSSSAPNFLRSELDTQSLPALLSLNTSGRSGTLARPHNPFKRSSPRKRATTRRWNGAARGASVAAAGDGPVPVGAGDLGVLADGDGPGQGNNSVFAMFDGDGEASRASNRKRLKPSFEVGDLQDVYPVDFSALSNPGGLTGLTGTWKLNKLEDVEKCKSAALPVDLRIGLKLRMECKGPFPWMGKAGNAPGKYPIRVSAVDHDTSIRWFCGTGGAGPGSGGDGEEASCSALKVDLAGRSSSFSNSPSSSSSSSLAQLQAATLYWQYPSLPWMRMFPRLDSCQKHSAGRMQEIQPSRSLQSLGDSVLVAFREQWTQAFEQLFHSWKKGLRDLFYLCGSSFTVLFLRTKRDRLLNEFDDESTCTSWPTAGREAYRVLITPTTLGFREQLRLEGVSYIMLSKHQEAQEAASNRRSSREFPGDDLLGGDRSRPSSRSLSTAAFDRSISQPAFGVDGHPEPSEKPEPVDFGGGDPDGDGGGTSTGNDGGNEGQEESPSKINLSDDMAENMEWLNDIGISPSSTKRLTKHLSMNGMGMGNASTVSNSSNGRGSASGMGQADDGAKTTVIVSEPSSIQALFNLINTSKIFRSIAGPYAGLPPTLIASKPFLHSSLCSLNKSAQIIRRRDNELLYVCELDNGPIMPHMMTKLFEFMADSNGKPTADSTTEVKAYVSGRSYCQGFNQALQMDGFKDLNEFSYRPQERHFYY